MSDFFTADLHLRHTNIIKYCKRPFASTAEHDEAIITNWNKVVTPKDTVYVLGDFAFADEKTIKYLRDKLNGKIILIRGNHDKYIPDFCFDRVYQYYDYTFTDKDLYKQTIVLCHYPFEVWNKKHYGSWHFYGHVHEKSLDESKTLRMNVGVDVCNFTPVSLQEAKEIMVNKIIKENLTFIQRDAKR